MKVMNPRLVRLARQLDFLWKPLAALRLAGRPPANPADPAVPVTSILVVDLHLVGDMVMLLPLLAALRTRYPAAHITLLAGPWSAAVLAGTRDFDETIPYVAPWVKSQPKAATLAGWLRTVRRLRQRRWDIGIDVRGDVRQILTLYLAGCRRRVGFDFTGGAPLLTDMVADDGRLAHLLDHHERIAAQLDAWDGRPFVPALTLTDAEREAAAAIPPFVGFHLGASLPLRRLPPADAAALVALHADAGPPLVFFSSPDMEDYTREVLALLPEAVAGRLEVWRGDLRGFIVKASRAERLFTMDSGPAHIAAALGRDTIVFFGPNLPRYTGPRGPRVRFLEDPAVPCRPCDQRHCVNPVHQACMRGLVDGWRRMIRAGGDRPDLPVAGPSARNLQNPT